MKKKILCFVMTLCFALHGCSGAEKPEIQQSSQAKSPSVQSTENKLQDANAFHEPNAVDDSYSFNGSFDDFRESGIVEYVDRWVKDGIIVDKETRGSIGISNGSGHIYGWVLFSGTPRQELGWNTVEYEGQQLYCRSIRARMDEQGVWQTEKSVYTLPAKALNDSYLQQNGIVDGISSAQLYVRQLDKLFTIEDESFISRLEIALSPNKGDGTKPGSVGLPLEYTDFLNPLYLKMEDGTTNLVYTAGDGSSGTDAFGSCAFNCSDSLFDLFSVPISAKGYTYNADGSTEVSVKISLQNGEMVFEREDVMVYDSNDRLITQKLIMNRNNSYNKYYYDDMGRLVTDEQYDGSGELIGKYEYSYTNFNMLNRMALTTSNGTVAYQHNYDELNRIVSIIFYDHSGAEGPIISNTYYWYDGAGAQHEYRFEADGSVIGELPPEGPMRK